MPSMSCSKTSWSRLLTSSIRRRRAIGSGTSIYEVSKITLSNLVYLEIRYVPDDEVEPYGAEKQPTEPPAEETSKFGQRVGTAHFNPTEDINKPYEEEFKEQRSSPVNEDTFGMIDPEVAAPSNEKDSRNQSQEVINTGMGEEGDHELFQQISKGDEAETPFIGMGSPEPYN